MCTNPVPAWYLGHKVFLREPPSPKDEFGLMHQPERFNVPCGKCFECRKSRIRDWTLRCALEACCHDQNCFLTLTYAPEHLPANGSLVKKDYQDFLKRLRKKYGKIRYFLCGEYGEKRGRPHYHCLLFGFRFPDERMLIPSPYSGELLYNSAELTRLWNKGLCVIGEVTDKSIAYVARYVNKKLLGGSEDELAKEYKGKLPEFISMSLKPGIGALFFDKYSTDFFPKDFFNWNGYKYKPPRYFEKLWRRSEGAKTGRYDFSEKYAKFKENRIARAIEHSQNCTDVDLARHNLFLETIEREQRKKRGFEVG